MLRASEISPRMFDNDLFDFFSRTPWWVVPLLWLPVAAGMLALGLVRGVPVPWALPEAVAGLVAWSLAEYVLHRTLFHWIPDTAWGPRFHFFVHGVHHQWVNDPYRLVMPPAASTALAVLFFGIFRLLLGPTWMWPLFAGFVVGYVIYDVSHYAIHHFKWQFKAFRKLKAHHMSHHHNKRYAALRFGVSSRFWDRVFGTMEPRT